MKMRWMVPIAAAAAAAGAQDDSAPRPVFGERVEVEVVDVDVVVTDRRGDRVTDLAREDFELRVDGELVPIEYFAAPRPRPPVVEIEEAAIAAPSVEIVEQPEVALPPSYLVVYVDQATLRPDRRNRAVAELREFVRGRRPGELVAIAAFADSRLHLVAPPSEEPAAIEAAFDRVLELPLDLSSIAEQRHLDARIRNLRPPSMRNPAELRQLIEQEAIQLEQEIRRWFDEEIARQRDSIAGLRQLVGSFAALEGRKSVVVASAGTTVEHAEYLRELLKQQMLAIGIYSEQLDRRPIELPAKQRVKKDFEAMVEAAQDARVALYTVYPLDDSMLRNSAEFASAGPSDKAMSRDPSVVDAAASLARMSGATGGRSFVIGRNLGRKLEAVRDDIDAAYSLGFTTGAAAGDGDHRIEVRVRGERLRVRHRESFRRRSAAELAEQALLAAASLGEETNPLAVRLDAAETAGDEGRVVSIAAHVPLRSIALLPIDDERRGQLSFKVALQGEKGDLYLSEIAAVPIVVPEADVERALTGEWVHRAEVPIRPTMQRLALLVVDEAAGTFATVTFALGGDG